MNPGKRVHAGVIVLLALTAWFLPVPAGLKDTQANKARLIAREVNLPPDKVRLTVRLICACDEMKQSKYCHCLLFVTPEGKPITEYLPEDHEGRQIYGLVKDPTPDKGREARHQTESPEPTV